MVVYGGVWWCMVVYGGEWWCMVVYGGVWWCMVVYGGVWWCMVVYGGVASPQTPLARAMQPASEKKTAVSMVQGGVWWCMMSDFTGWSSSEMLLLLLLYLGLRLGGSCTKRKLQ